VNLTFVQTDSAKDTAALHHMNKAVADVD